MITDQSLSYQQRKYNQKGYRPDQKALLINKLLCGLLIMVMATMVIVHGTVSDYLLTPAPTIVGFMNTFQKYMWKQV